MPKRQVDEQDDEVAMEHSAVLMPDQPRTQ
jgi:hypothetical protein